MYSVRQVIRHEVEAGCEQRREEVVKRELRSLYRGRTLGCPYFAEMIFMSEWGSGFWDVPTFL